MSQHQRGLVLVKLPFGANAAEVEAEIGESQILGTPEFETYLDRIYKRHSDHPITDPIAQTKECLMSLAEFVEAKIKAYEEAHEGEALPPLYRELKDKLHTHLIPGINKNSASLSSSKDRLEELCYLLTKDDPVELEANLQTILALYSPISLCIWGAQNELIQHYEFLTARSLEQKLGRLATSAIKAIAYLYISRDGLADHTHADSRNILYAYGQGLVWVAGARNLDEPHGQANPTQVSKYLQEKFTLAAFLDDEVTTASHRALSVPNVGSKIKLSLSEMGLIQFADEIRIAPDSEEPIPDGYARVGKYYVKDGCRYEGQREALLDKLFAEDPKHLKDLEAAVGFCIEFTRENVDHLIKCPGPKRYIELCNKLAQLKDDIEAAITVFTDALPQPNTGWSLLIRKDQAIEIWHNQELVMQVPVGHDLHGALTFFVEKKSDEPICAWELYDNVLVNNQIGFGELNFDFLRYMALRKMIEKHMIGTTTHWKDYSVLRPPSDLVDYQDRELIVVKPGVNIWLLQMSGRMEMFIEDSNGKYLDFASLSLDDQDAIINKSRSILAKLPFEFQRNFALMFVSKFKTSLISLDELFDAASSREDLDYILKINEPDRTKILTRLYSNPTWQAKLIQPEYFSLILSKLHSDIPALFMFLESVRNRDSANFYILLKWFILNQPQYALPILQEFYDWIPEGQLRQEFINFLCQEDIYQDTEYVAKFLLQNNIVLPAKHPLHDPIKYYFFTRRRRDRINILLDDAHDNGKHDVSLAEIFLYYYKKSSYHSVCLQLLNDNPNFANRFKEKLSTNEAPYNEIFTILTNWYISVFKINRTFTLPRETSELMRALDITDIPLPVKLRKSLKLPAASPLRHAAEFSLHEYFVDVLQYGELDESTKMLQLHELFNLTDQDYAAIIAYARTRMQLKDGYFSLYSKIIEGYRSNHSSTQILQFLHDLFEAARISGHNTPDEIQKFARFLMLQPNVLSNINNENVLEVIEFIDQNVIATPNTLLVNEIYISILKLCYQHCDTPDKIDKLCAAMHKCSSREDFKANDTEFLEWIWPHFVASLESDNPDKYADFIAQLIVGSLNNKPHDILVFIKSRAAALQSNATVLKKIQDKLDSMWQDAIEATEPVAYLPELSATMKSIHILTNDKINALLTSKINCFSDYGVTPDKINTLYAHIFVLARRSLSRDQDFATQIQKINEIITPYFQAITRAPLGTWMASNVIDRYKKLFEDLFDFIFNPRLRLFSIFSTGADFSAYCDLILPLLEQTLKAGLPTSTGGRITYASERLIDFASTLFVSSNNPADKALIQRKLNQLLAILIETHDDDKHDHSDLIKKIVDFMQQNHLPINNDTVYKDGSNLIWRPTAIKLYALFYPSNMARLLIPPRPEHIKEHLKYLLQHNKEALWQSMDYYLELLRQRRKSSHADRLEPDFQSDAQFIQWLITEIISNATSPNDELVVSLEGYLQPPRQDANDLLAFFYTKSAQKYLDQFTSDLTRLSAGVKSQAALKRHGIDYRANYPGLCRYFDAMINACEKLSEYEERTNALKEHVATILQKMLDLRIPPHVIFGIIHQTNNPNLNAIVREILQHNLPLREEILKQIQAEYGSFLREPTTYGSTVGKAVRKAMGTSDELLWDFCGSMAISGILEPWFVKQPQSASSDTATTGSTGFLTSFIRKKPSAQVADSTASFVLDPITIKHRYRNYINMLRLTGFYYGYTPGGPDRAVKSQAGDLLQPYPELMVAAMLGCVDKIASKSEARQTDFSARNALAMLESCFLKANHIQKDFIFNYMYDHYHSKLPNFMAGFSEVVRREFVQHRQGRSGAV